jgi:hypothetical protein
MFTKQDKMCPCMGENVNCYMCDGKGCYTPEFTHEHTLKAQEKRRERIAMAKLLYGKKVA